MAYKLLAALGVGACLLAVGGCRRTPSLPATDDQPSAAGAGSNTEALSMDAAIDL